MPAQAGIQSMPEEWIPLTLNFTPSGNDGEWHGNGACRSVSFSHVHQTGVLAHCRYEAWHANFLLLRTQQQTCYDIGMPS